MKLWEIVNAILYKLKTGVQWYLLPIKELIYRKSIKWGAIYHHYRKWVKDGSWQQVLDTLIQNHKHLLDMSICHFDGTHTPSKRGGQKVSYQGRKRAKTTNSLILTDRTGLIVTFSDPISGKHNDTFQAQYQLNTLEKRLKKNHISMNGLFINVDAGFDNKSFHQACISKGIILNNPANKRNSKVLKDDYLVFDSLMYQQRYVVERTNAWMDTYRTLLVRQDTSVLSWSNWIIIFTILQWIKTININAKL